jgi:hypothetical protein
MVHHNLSAVSDEHGKKIAEKEFSVEMKKKDKKTESDDVNNEGK